MFSGMTTLLAENEAMKASGWSFRRIWYAFILLRLVDFVQTSLDLDTSTDGRPGLTRSDYDYFRAHERVPTKIKNILGKSR